MGSCLSLTSQSCSVLQSYLLAYQNQNCMGPAPRKSGPLAGISCFFCCLFFPRHGKFLGNFQSLGSITKIVWYMKWRSLCLTSVEITEWLIVTFHSSLCAVQGILNETSLPPPALLQFNSLCKLNLPGGFPKQEASFLNRGTRGSDYLILVISIFFFNLE